MTFVPQSSDLLWWARGFENHDTVYGGAPRGGQRSTTLTWCWGICRTGPERSFLCALLCWAACTMSWSARSRTIRLLVKYGIPWNSSLTKPLLRDCAHWLSSLTLIRCALMRIWSSIWDRCHPWFTNSKQLETTWVMNNKSKLASILCLTLENKWDWTWHRMRTLRHLIIFCVIWSLKLSGLEASKANDASYTAQFGSRRPFGSKRKKNQSEKNGNPGHAPVSQKN